MVLRNKMGYVPVPLPLLLPLPVLLVLLNVLATNLRLRGSTTRPHVPT